MRNVVPGVRFAERRAATISERDMVYVAALANESLELKLIVIGLPSTTPKDERSTANSNSLEAYEGETA